jgi:hypothetical protein
LSATSWLRAGDLVEVLSESEILATLDRDGRLDGLPFMPEMLPYSGRVVRVYKRADKTCVPPEFHGLRRMEDAVLLWGARCDGSAHGGCEAACLMFWKAQWLRPVAGPGDSRGARPAAIPVTQPGVTTTGITRSDLDRLTSAGPAQQEVWSCQATRLAQATTPLPSWDIRQYARDIEAGNVTLRHALPILARGVGRVARRTAVAIITRLDPRHGRRLTGAPPGRKSTGGASGDGAPPVTPMADGGGWPAQQSNLRPGDRVRVRHWPEIAATLDHRGATRGLMFRPEMRQYCGREFTVRHRIRRTIDEQTGRMRTLNPCVVLEGIACSGDYARFCPRANYFWWREDWLIRVAQGPTGPSAFGEQEPASAATSSS